MTTLRSPGSWDTVGISWTPRGWHCHGAKPTTDRLYPERAAINRRVVEDASRTGWTLWSDITAITFRTRSPSYALNALDALRTHIASVALRTSNAWNALRSRNARWSRWTNGTSDTSDTGNPLRTYIAAITFCARCTRHAS
jgi:hypothetical protein